MNLLSSTNYSLLSTVILISTGASLGATLRWILSSNLNQLHGKLPFGTIAANLLGGLLIGFFYQYSESFDLSEKHKIFIVTGFLGALTTFSSFTLEFYQLLSKGEYVWAILHPLMHFIGSLILLGLGVYLAKSFSQ